MPDYRLRRLRGDGVPFDGIAFTSASDKATIAEAIRIDHADYVEVWRDDRIVSRVAPAKIRNRPSAS
ncbi:hypothetical protein [Sphingomonas immobilis]|uniref:Uncharacterized protein n=1 Tax=Sphingomonas immobilis TaxID=3063997 RepID=A0ABT9A2J9_9SPHN|nr:hypothetical protein [Sphingomonas sp. CA1-15]MDO7843574.1 hypothetical protein [Sphingomonas sp. CA1-15]